MKVLSVSFLLVLSQGLTAAAAAAAAAGSASERNHQATPDSRIIDGDDAVQGRHPYMASIQDVDDLEYYCGGTLIAPDIVLTAAQCIFIPELLAVRIDPRNWKIPVEGSEIFPVLESAIHPDFTDTNLGYMADFGLLKLDGTSNNAPVRLNQDSVAPVDGQQASAIGWNEESDDGQDESGFLQVYDSLLYIDNAECERMLIQAGDFRQDETLSSDMICTMVPDGGGVDFDDTGGSLFIPGASADQDVQVGITSWFVSSETLSNPSIFARISWGYDFIRANVCRMSVDPPSGFNCTDSELIRPTAMPTSSPAPTGEQVDILLQIFTDFFPLEIGWRLETSNGRVLYEKGPASYRQDDSAVLEILSVDIGAEYVLVLTDTYGDGIFVSVAVQVFLGNSVDPKQLLASSAFPEAFEQRITFLASVDGLQPEAPLFTLPPQPMEPTLTPSLSIAPTGSNLIDVVVFIKFDSRPVDTSWTLKRVDGRTMAKGGSYSLFIGDSITQVVSVEVGQTYVFTMFDSADLQWTPAGNGICCEYGFGEAYVYLGSQVPSIETENALVHDNGRFEGERSHTFVASQDAIIDFTMAPTLSPTISSNPTMTQRPTPIPIISAWPVSTAWPASTAWPVSMPVIPVRPPSSIKPSVPISIVIWFDQSPEEVSWTLFLEGDAIMDVFPGAYTNELSSQMVHNIVELEMEQRYTLYIYDTADDGYCCENGVGNFTVYAGTEPVESNLLLAGSGNSEIVSFVVPDDLGAAVPSPVSAAKSSVPVSIVLWFDEFPGEVGWRLERNGNIITDLEGGTYGNLLISQTVQTIMELEIDATYEISFFDSGGDGYCCDHGKGRITVYIGTEPIDSNILAASSGELEAFESAQFVVPALPSHMPSTTPSVISSDRPSTTPSGMLSSIPTIGPSLAVAQPSSSPNSSSTSLSAQSLLVLFPTLIGSLLIHGGILA